MEVHSAIPSLCDSVMEHHKSPLKKKLSPNATHSLSKHITIDILRPHFEKPLAEVAKLFGICTTLMKKVCRRVGIPRWPHRHIRSLRKSILSMETASTMFEGEDRAAYDIQIRKQHRRLAMLLHNPNSIDLDDDDEGSIPEDQPIVSSPPLQHRSHIDTTLIQPIPKLEIPAIRTELPKLKPLDLNVREFNYINCHPSYYEPPQQNDYTYRSMPTSSYYDAPASYTSSSNNQFASFPPRSHHPLPTLPSISTWYS
ncbi:RWP-RK domain-containing protein [Thraustotheca clavata]|uniref:RWP-RK domain-containing protein n=1 Tax=Thraustotheca clavata TaxID=74557 RepID=A0A1V9ZP39_9STRA|nr:RWP-RK domain-containing protein [Thraustotheca clavata]